MRTLPAILSRVCVLALGSGLLWPGLLCHANPANAVSPSTHWAFQPLQHPAVPAVKNKTWGRTPIDRFILARLEAAKIAPSAEASRRTLIRRVTYDLIGLPPTPE